MKNNSISNVIIKNIIIDEWFFFVYTIGNKKYMILDSNI